MTWKSFQIMLEEADGKKYSATFDVAIGLECKGKFVDVNGKIHALDKYYRTLHSESTSLNIIHNAISTDGFCTCGAYIDPNDPENNCVQASGCHDTSNNCDKAEGYCHQDNKKPYSCKCIIGEGKNCRSSGCGSPSKCPSGQVCRSSHSNYKKPCGHSSDPCGSCACRNA
jgi:hypothetical protein